MDTARVFKSGNSQAIRLPKEFRVNTSEVEIFRRGDGIVLREKPRTAAAVFDHPRQPARRFHGRGARRPAASGKGAFIGWRAMCSIRTSASISPNTVPQPCSGVSSTPIPGRSPCRWSPMANCVMGRKKSRRREEALGTLAMLTDAISILDLPQRAGTHYGTIRSSLERACTPIGANDLWVAAHALAEDLTLVTNNGREFGRIEGLRVENWAE